MENEIMLDGLIPLERLQKKALPYWINYNSPSYTEIQSVYTSGRPIFMEKDNRVYYLSCKESNKLCFISMQDNTIYVLKLSSANTWESGTVDVQLQSNIVTSWNDPTSDGKYPSEKLTKDTINTEKTTLENRCSTIESTLSSISSLLSSIKSSIAGDYDSEQSYSNYAMAYHDGVLKMYFEAADEWYETTISDEIQYIYTNW